MSAHKRMTSRRWQETFDVDGHKITVIVQQRTIIGNHGGFYVDIHDNRGNKMRVNCFATLFPGEAQKKGYAAFVKEYGDES